MIYWIIFGWIACGVLGFYIVAPIWSVVDGWVKYGFQERGWHILYSWKIWPFYQSGDWVDGKWRKGDWGPWYRCTFRWWLAKYRCWRYPPTCEFCDKIALGCYAHCHAPVSISVCGDHAYKLQERIWVDESEHKGPKPVISEEEYRHLKEAGKAN